MRVAVICADFPTTTETFVGAHVDGLRARGVEVDVFAGHAKPASSEIPGVRYHHMATRYAARLSEAVALLAREGADTTLLRTLNPIAFGRDAWSLRLLFSAAQWLPHRSYDIVHCHFGPNGIRAAMLRQLGLLSGRIVTTFHGADLSEYVRARGAHCYDRLFAAGDLFLPVSDHFRKRLVDMGADPSRVITHHMGVDCARFTPADRARPSVGAGKLFVSTARLVEKKGLADALRAFAGIKSQLPSVRYEIIGDGPHRGALEALVDELGLRLNVSFLGMQPHERVREKLRQADVFVAPSVADPGGDEEGIPVSIMEAMACAVPVVTTRHSGIPELVENGVSGLLVGERDVPALAQAFRRLASNAEERERLGRAGRTRVLEHFNDDRLQTRLVEQYQRLVRT